MKRIIFCLYVITCILTLSCTQYKECPAFDEADLQYLPYVTGDTLVFHNEQAESYQIYIEELRQSEAYDFTCRDLYGICACTDYVEVMATDTENPDPYIFLRMEQSDVSDVQYFQYQLLDYDFEFDFRNELPHIDDFPHIEFKDSLLIGEHVYHEVLMIRNQDQSASRIDKVYFNQCGGILKFCKENPAEKWELICNP